MVLFYCLFLKNQLLTQINGRLVKYSSIWPNFCTQTHCLTCLRTRFSCTVLGQHIGTILQRIPAWTSSLKWLGTPIWFVQKQSRVNERFRGPSSFGLGSILSTYWPTKWSNNWQCSLHTSGDQIPIPCVPIIASPGLKPKGRVWEEWMLRRFQTGQAWLELQSQ